MSKLEIYDCTLREGEQAVGVSFSIEDRLEILKALNDIGIEYAEFGWPINEETMQAFHKASNLVKKEGMKIKICAFGSTSMSDNVKEDRNLNSLIKSKAKIACIFGKSWLEHVEKQLKISKEENLEKIESSIRFLLDNGLEVFYDAEHYFDAFKHDSEYALSTIIKASEAGASHIILCDTNGGILIDEAIHILKKTSEKLKEKNIKTELGVHFHNDSGLALALSISSLPFIKQIHVTVNGLGERVGNADLCELLPILILKKGLKLNIKLDNLKSLSELVYDKSNLPKQIRQAFVSSRAFSHKGGVHIDATRKGASYSHINPENIGLKQELMLSSLGGGATVVHSAEKLGIKLNKKDPKTREKISKLLKELSILEKQGYDLENIKAEHFLLIEKYFGNLEDYFKIEKWQVESDIKESKVKIKIKVNGEEIKEDIKIRGGPVHALYQALFEVVSKKHPKIKDLKLKDYKVRIVSSKGEESSVRTRIEFSFGNEEFSTVGVDENILKSSLEAIEKGFKYYLNIINKKEGK